MNDAISVPVMDPEQETKVLRLPPYHVILENDDHHGMEFVVHVLREVFKYDLPKSFQIMMQAHEKGEAIAWTGSKEVAELKLEQMLTFHEKQARTGDDLGPLGCRIEPAN